ncbi:Response regulator receiver protein [Desulfamplus magnetovallimortis]|uniref:Response regulator receiver protein n=1 Tax=Desulfamplus magnetovallimortis TaxID=1246637 RepID=A0A1W1HHM4_9BACT|nr:response regulator [Desulfamplus magnetovallimortis]SLM31979.1 Response regulator receiver protein [Desulfamplus magnetovallimortis]
MNKEKEQKKPTIMIVEDVPANLHILIELLKNDYRVIPVKDGETALKKLSGIALPDLVLLDIVMPGMDGYEVCRNLKNNPATKEIPVIFITAVSEAMDDAKAFEIGAVDYITKPFNPLTVKARVRTHVNLSQTVKALQEALKKIKTLNGLLPICSSCKKIRDDKGYWNLLEAYIEKRSDASFTHSLCPNCIEQLYGDEDWYKKKKVNRHGRGLATPDHENNVSISTVNRHD